MKTVISITIDKGLLNPLQEFADENDLSLSYVLRRAGREFLERFNKPQTPALSSKEIAARAGISPSTLSRIRRGAVKPRAATAEAIAKAMGTTPDTLFPTNR